MQIPQTGNIPMVFTQSPSSGPKLIGERSLRREAITNKEETIAARPCRGRWNANSSWHRSIILIGASVITMSGQ